MKAKPKPCRCKAYDFPHRLAGGSCTWETRDRHYGYVKDSRDDMRIHKWLSNQAKYQEDLR